ncbi:SgcJ/EcaC family oxidoreductase [Rhizorhabdus histidinilytica]|nr:SgcJ/EcaC family oxidoreductase [Rhizorhabdus histidinilytica]
MMTETRDEAMMPADLGQRFEAAWNAHDMDAFGRLFHADATFVNRFGTYWRGVDQIVAGHAAIHASIYSDSTLEIDAPDVDPISDDVAILHFWSRLNAGAAHPAGPHPVDTLIMAVATRRAGEWRIQALENVTLVNPRTGETILRR